jgi:peptidoglycan hydrolase CwlO-like protein
MAIGSKGFSIMCKKLLIAAIALAVGVGVVSGTRLGSHIRLKWHKAQQWAQQQVPLESEIERLKMEVANLSREDDRYYDRVAKQKIQVKQLSARIAKSNEELAVREARIKTLREALAQDNEFVVYNGERYSRQDAQTEVRLDATRFLADEKLLKQDKENLKILEQTLAANKSKLDGLALRRKEMEAQLLDLEKQLAQQRLLEQTAMTVDDSRYNKVSKEIEEARERLELQRTKGELRGDAVKGPISVQEEKKAKERQLEKAIEERFGKVGGDKVTSR